MFFQVGMMRFGRLLAEDAPAALIQNYGQTSLEAVFLSLCMDNGDTDEESRASSKEGSVELETIVTRQHPGTYFVKQQRKVVKIICNDN